MLRVETAMPETRVSGMRKQRSEGTQVRYSPPQPSPLALKTFLKKTGYPKERPLRR
jgi:hypothetical protein